MRILEKIKFTINEEIKKPLKWCEDNIKTIKPKIIDPYEWGIEKAELYDCISQLEKQVKALEEKQR